MLEEEEEVGCFLTKTAALWCQRKVGGGWGWRRSNKRRKLFVWMESVGLEPEGTVSKIIRTDLIKTCLLDQLPAIDS